MGYDYDYDYDGRDDLKGHHEAGACEAARENDPAFWEEEESEDDED